MILAYIGNILLSMVGYSIGRVLPQRDQYLSAELYDGVALLVLWAASFSFNIHPLWNSQLFWMEISFLVGLLITTLFQPHPQNHSPNLLRTENTEVPKKFLNSWKNFIFHYGNFQSRLILLFFYFTVLLPFGIFQKIFKDSLDLKKPRRNTLWFDYSKQNEKIEQARRQF